MTFWEAFLLLALIGLILSLGAFVYIITDVGKDVE